MWFLIALLFDLEDFLPFACINIFSFVFYSFGIEMTFSNHLLQSLKTPLHLLSYSATINQTRLTSYFLIIEIECGRRFTERTH